MVYKSVQKIYFAAYVGIALLDVAVLWNATLSVTRHRIVCSFCLCTMLSSACL